MYNHLLFLAYWGLNSLVLMLGAVLAPEVVVLGGGSKFIAVEAAVYGGFWMTFVLWCVWDFAVARGFAFTKGVNAAAWVYFAVANLFAVVAVSVMRRMTGVVVEGWGGLVLVALLANASQRWLRGLVVSWR